MMIGFHKHSRGQGLVRLARYLLAVAAWGNQTIHPRTRVIPPLEHATLIPVPRGVILRADH